MTEENETCVPSSFETGAMTDEDLRKKLGEQLLSCLVVSEGKPYLYEHNHFLLVEYLAEFVLRKAATEGKKDE